MHHLPAPPLFEDSPQVELLQWLARGSLKQNLLRAVRLWVCLQSLYGHGRMELSEPFTYAQWRAAFFSASHPKSETVPALHDSNCACTKTTADWLFTNQTELSQSDWRQAVKRQTGMTAEDVEDWLKKRLFAVTRRSLAADLQILCELGWLTAVEGGYGRVQSFPARPMTVEPVDALEPLELLDLGFLQPNLEAIAESLAHPVADVQRFYLEVDYIVSQSVSQSQRRLEHWLEQLKALWALQPVPVRLTYRSAKYGKIACVVYPVCLYYAQRAVYLCGFGQTPLEQGEWYHYRLDKIEQMQQLDWDDLAVPALLRQRRTTLPTPDYTRQQMREAWGFDFYLPAHLMLLRFEQEFHERYIQDTFRHQTFKRLSYAQVMRMIKQLPELEHERLLPIIQQRSEQDAYYRVRYRMGDTNVGLRLRAWRPRLEVLLPWALRQQMAHEVELEQSFYRE